LLPALAVGCASLTIVTADVAEGQLALDTVHKNVLVPVPRAVTEVEYEPGDARLPAPESNDHTPVPIVGLTASRVADDVHKV
jgi:hypothetical protein